MTHNKREVNLLDPTQHKGGQLVRPHTAKGRSPCQTPHSKREVNLPDPTQHKEDNLPDSTQHKGGQLARPHTAQGRSTRQTPHSTREVNLPDPTQHKGGRSKVGPVQEGNILRLEMFYILETQTHIGLRQQHDYLFKILLEDTYIFQSFNNLSQSDNRLEFYTIALYFSLYKHTTDDTMQCHTPETKCVY